MDSPTFTQSVQHVSRDEDKDPFRWMGSVSCLVVMQMGGTIKEP